MEDCAKNIIDISDIKLNSNTYLKSKCFQIFPINCKYKIIIV